VSRGLSATAELIVHTSVAFDTPVRGPRRIIAIVWYGKSRMVGLRDGEKTLKIRVIV